MFRLSVVVVALASFDAIVAAAAKASKRTYAVKEVFNPPPAWSKGRAADPNHVLRLRFGLPQGDFASLEKHLLEVSDPSHERYGAHLSKAEVENLVAPKQGHISAVEEWLAEHGFGSSDLERSPAGDWIIIAVPVSKAEELLDTTYNVWTHTDGTELVRTTTYSLPVDLHDAIEVVQPTNMFGRLRPNRATSFLEDYNPAPLVSVSGFASGGSPTVDASCNATITPLCLQQLYNTVGYTPTNKDNALGIAGYLEQYANFQDLKDFYAKYYPQAVNSTLAVELISGGTNSQNISESGAEAALDVQYGGALTFPTKNIYYSTGGRPPFNPSTSTPTNTNEPYADWVDYMLKKDHPPQTVTTSYGDDEVTVPKSYAQRVCQSFAQLGARGVSLMFSSGDFGVGDGNPDPATAVCLSNDGKNTTMFLPIFPGGCPYVTTVGGTHFITPEVAVAFTGGGFSNYFDRPIYQTLDVQAYVDKLGKTYKGLYNPNGRAYPDVAAQGSHFRIILSGVDRSIGGTSASSPAFASVISLVNDARLNAKLPPLGFLNPWLYTVGRFGLNDITAGNNPGCGTPGFNATAGWDPVTGLGTPNFQKLKKLAGVIF